MSAIREAVAYGLKHDRCGGPLTAVGVLAWLVVLGVFS